MLSLTRIFLHNWHRFNHQVIDVEDSLYLAGHNGSGKSSVLDALQLVLIADMQRVRFNSSAQTHERSARTLDSYVRGKIGESRWLRPGNTVAYIALEFTDKDRDAKHLTIGVCIEAGEGKGPSGERTFFILPGALDVNFFTPDGRPLTRRELKQALRNRRSRSYDHVHEYLDEMRHRLGGLNQRFFDLFLRALAFQPIRRIGEFVEKWLLPEEELDVETLKQVVERLDQLRVAAGEVEEKLAALRAITGQQAEVRRLRERLAEYIVLAALLRRAAIERRIAALAERIEEAEKRLQQLQAERESLRASHKGAQEAWVQAQLQLKQSDVARRRDELEKELREAIRGADEITRRWDELRGDLRKEAETLQPLLAEANLKSLAPLEPDEAESLSKLLSGIASLTSEEPPHDELSRLIADAAPKLEAAYKRAMEAQFRIEQQSEDLRKRGRELEQELESLRGRGRAAYYPDNVERLRDLLTPALGARPPLLCELLEVPVERWQDAVEAMLGARRFTIIAPPQKFDAALRILDEARAREKLYEVRLLDLDKASSEARPARADSLAMKIGAEDPLLRAYVDTILGDLITCESVDELRRHRRAVTPDVVFYGEWAVRAIRPENYRPWFIGARAQRSQIEARERELQDIRERLLALHPQSSAVKSLVMLLERCRKLDDLRRRLDEPLDARPLRARVGECSAEMRSLDLSGVEALEREAARLAAVVEGELQTLNECILQTGQVESRRQAMIEQKQATARELSEAAQQCDETRAEHPRAIIAAEELLDEKLRATGAQSDLGEIIRNAESQVKRFETQAGNEQDRLTRMATGYNTRYQFAGETSDPAGNSYAFEEQRLAATELPSYQRQIAEERQRAEQQLREHVLHRLREKILLAKQELDRINRALKDLEFHHKRYKFRYQPSEQFRAYYDLILETQTLGAQSLFESEFYLRHKDAFDEFYRQLTSPWDDAERESLTDYRRYLSYDIEIMHGDGQTSMLSKIMGQTSGGETQTPFYLTIAASFLQLYSAGEPASAPRASHSKGAARRSTIRLVAFDEAFSKMDQDHIGSTLDLFQKFNLQVITATPLERCEYLVPKMCTSLVLTAVNDSVLVEPYRNYAARLREIQEAEEFPEEVAEEAKAYAD
ncbi:MAG: ATP-binding protein [Blastocatellales bacterium]